MLYRNIENIYNIKDKRIKGDFKKKSGQGSTKGKMRFELYERPS